MKVAYYMTTILEHGGGMEKYLIESAARMSEIQGIQADVITMDDTFTDRFVSLLGLFYLKRIDKKLSHKENLDDIKRKLGKATYIKENSIKNLRQRLNEYDVIYSKNELLEGLLYRFLIRFTKVPPVIFGGHTPLRYSVALSIQAKVHNLLYSSFVYKFLAKPVAAFHVLNTYELQIYKSIFPKHEVQKIYNPFNAKEFRDNARIHYKDLGLKSSQMRILWIGRLTEQKGITELVELVRKVNGQNENNLDKFCWTIVGDGEFKPFILELKEKFENVNYLGHVDQKFMASIYSQHDIFVSTSKWEGYPYTLIEAQVFGLESFGFAIPGVVDILEAYEGGNIAQNVQDLSEKLNSKISKSDLKKYKTSRQFEPKMIYDQLLNLLEKYAASTR